MSEQFSTAEYLALNGAIGLGLAADAMIATLGRFREFDRTSDALKWASAIGLTHWLFPMFGFLGGWYFASNSSVASAIYAGAAIVMFVYIGALVRRATRPAATEPGARSFWGAVWVVSIDALVTGPGNTAATARWTSEQVWISFVIVGAVVFVLVLLAAFLAVRLRTWVHRSVARSRALLLRVTIGGVWLEIVIFGWFGFLAVAESLRARGAAVHDLWVFVADVVLAAVLAATVGRRISAAQRRSVDVTLDPTAREPG